MILRRAAPGLMLVGGLLLALAVWMAAGPRLGPDAALAAPPSEALLPLPPEPVTQRPLPPAGSQGRLASSAVPRPGASVIAEASGRLSPGGAGGSGSSGQPSAPASPTGVVGSPSPAGASPEGAAGSGPLTTGRSALEAEQADLRRRTPARPSRLLIPAIEVDAPVEPVSLRLVDAPDGSYFQWDTAAYAVGWHQTSARLGEPGNTVLSAHNNILGEVFRRLSELRQGDLILAQSGGRTVRYRVADAFVLREIGVPQEVRLGNARWIAPSRDERLTLVSCWPYRSNTHRVVVVAFPDR